MVSVLIDAHCLFSEKDAVLKWEKRVKILRDCALALRYLHHYVDGCIVHRDIKVTFFFFFFSLSLSFLSSVSDKVCVLFHSLQTFF